MVLLRRMHIGISGYDGKELKDEFLFCTSNILAC